MANSYLPEDTRDYNMEFSDKGLNRILYNIAQTHSPEEYVKVNKALSDLGLKTSFMNGETMTLQDLAPVIDRKAIYEKMDAELNALDRKDPEFSKKRDAIHQKYNVLIEKQTSEAALKNRNNIAMAVLSGARGKASQLKAMISTPGTYTDYKGDPVPVFSRESFAEGVRPVTFLAGSYGTRASVSSIKRGTAKGGDLAKQFAQACADLVIRKDDCGTHNGIKLDIGDKSCKGRTLGADIGGYHAGDTVTRQMIHDLEKKGIKNIVCRSPLTCSVENGLCAKCMGRFIDGGKMPKIGDHIGAVSASTVAEPVTQMALSSKHTAGMTEAKKTYSGLGTIIQFTQSPEKFKDRSAVATVDGKVESIEDAPQGGKYITVAGKQHYVPAGHEAEVKVGQEVEAGDFLSEGLGDAEEVIKYKGLGAGRLYYANRLNQMLADSGAGSDKRLTEVLARGAIRHVRITSNNQVGNYLPDDVVDYNVMQNNYRMPEGAKPMRAKDANGKYLQQPILHYSIGTRITPSVIKDLNDVGYENVYAADEKPDFEPEMIRLRGASHTSPDWMASQGTSYLTKQLQEGVTRGDDTNVIDNADWRPRLAFGAGFGKDVRTTGQF